jgi:hypothetical protein
MTSIQSISLFSAILLLSGCGYYEVSLSGVKGTSKNYIVRPDASIAVIAEIKTTDLAQEKEVKTKIEKLLKTRGYMIGTILDSDYYLLFTYGIRNGQTALDGKPGNQHGGTETANIAGTDGSSAASVQLKETTSNRPDSDTNYTRWLNLKLVDGNYYRETKKIRCLWAEDVTSSGPNSNLREIIDYLLIPAIGHFNENTGKQVTETIKDGDQRIIKLMEPHDIQTQ